jgi:hypothetical protein
MINDFCVFVSHEVSYSLLSTDITIEQKSLIIFYSLMIIYFQNKTIIKET